MSASDVCKKYGHLPADSNSRCPRCIEVIGDADDADGFEALDGFMIESEGTLYVTSVDTKVGKFQLLLPGVDASERRGMVADFTGIAIRDGSPAKVTIMYEFPDVKDWVLRLLALMAKIGWWKP